VKDSANPFVVYGNKPRRTWDTFVFETPFKTYGIRNKNEGNILRWSLALQGIAPLGRTLNFLLGGLDDNNIAWVVNSLRMAQDVLHGRSEGNYPHCPLMNVRKDHCEVIEFSWVPCNDLSNEESPGVYAIQHRDTGLFLRLSYFVNEASGKHPKLEAALKDYLGLDVIWSSDTFSGAANVLAGKTYGLGIEEPSLYKFTAKDCQITRLIPNDVLPNQNHWMPSKEDWLDPKRFLLDKYITAKKRGDTEAMAIIQQLIIDEQKG
jgi:hypothetical protein